MAYAGLGANAAQPPTSRIVNPDGTTTYFYGPAAAVQANFPTAAQAVAFTPAEQAAIVSAAQGVGPGTQGSSLTPWLVAGGAVLGVLLLLRK